MFVRDESGGTWQPIELSPFAAMLRNERPPKTEMIKGVAVVVIVAAALVSVVTLLSHRTERSADDLIPPPATALVAPALSCRLTIPGSTLGPLVFPEREGLAAFDAAALAHMSGASLKSLVTSYGGFVVEPGTKCGDIDSDPFYAHVLIAEGPFIGATVWAPLRYTISR
ncbi:MAG: hypothetical protein ABI548_01630 [Polyangiaceae bacterium]